MCFVQSNYLSTLIGECHEQYYLLGWFHCYPPRCIKFCGSTLNLFAVAPHDCARIAT